MNAAYRYYTSRTSDVSPTSPNYLGWREYKRLYGKMLAAMRRDGFTMTERLSEEELAMNIPWTIGNELEDRKASAQGEQRRLPASNQGRGSGE